MTEQIEQCLADRFVYAEKLGRRQMTDSTSMHLFKITQLTRYNKTYLPPCWLRFPQRIEFKLVLAYKFLFNQAPH